MNQAESLTAPILADVVHGFFTRRGGVSSGAYASLNCSLLSGDDPGRIGTNRARVAARLDLAPDRLLGVTQTHGTDVATVVEPWAVGDGPRADALVTRIPGLGLGIVTADCAPILFVDREAQVCGAAHAGWRGALAGIIEATIAAMTALGARPDRISAAIGPCIGLASYEVGDDMRDTVMAADPAACFQPGGRPGHHQFDLPAYCRRRATQAGLSDIASLDLDTRTDEDRFFSHRRRTLAGGGPIGHQISVIRL